MNNDQIIQKIKAENLKPISRNVFLFRKISIWFLLLISTIFGAYAFAFFFLKTLYIDFDNWYYFASSYNMFLIDNIPYIWASLFILSLFLVFYLFKKTNNGYKYSVVFIGAGSLLISFSLGAALSKVMIQNRYFVERFENERFIDWTNPEAGRLSGEVLFIQDEYILIRDIKDDVWNVDISYVLDNSKDMIKNYDLVSLIGKHDYENNFTACQIMPLNIDKVRFKPNPKHKPLINPHKESIFIKDICDFVINGR
jgi:hypothetical protein